MIAVLQRAAKAAVVADGVPAGSIDRGLLILLGVAAGDTREDAELLCKKILACRIFEDEAGKMNLSVRDIGGGVLVVSNFTLLAGYSHGNRPEFLSAAKPAEAVPLYEYFVELCRRESLPVGTGVFGADMRIDLRCDGPVTIVMDSNLLKKKKERTQ